MLNIVKNPGVSEKQSGNWSGTANNSSRWLLDNYYNLAGSIFLLGCNSWRYHIPPLEVQLPLLNQNNYLLWKFLMTKLCQTFIISLWIVNWFKNTFYEFGTLLHCFSDCSFDYHSVIAQNALFGPYAGAKARALSIALSTALCWRLCQMSNSSSTLWIRNWYTRCWTRQ